MSGLCEWSGIRVAYTGVRWSGDVGRGGWCGSDRASNDDAGLHGMARTGRASTLEVLE